MFYISEFSKETYRNEYDIYNLKYYLQKTHGKKIDRNMIILRNLIEKLHEIHTNFSN